MLLESLRQSKAEDARVGLVAIKHEHTYMRDEHRRAPMDLATCAERTIGQS
jgi:hypothetical protein